MIIAHLFIRNDKHKSIMMCETTATEGMTAPYPTPECLFEVDEGDNPKEWEQRACQRVLRDCPEVELYGVSHGKRSRKNRPCSIDLIFKKKKGLLGKLGLK